jgi:hypothetical protein
MLPYLPPLQTTPDHSQQPELGSLSIHLSSLSAAASEAFAKRLHVRPERAER